MEEPPAPEPFRTRTCPACGTTWATRFERCPECLTNAYRTPRAVVRRRLALLAAALVLVVTAAGVVSVLAVRDRDARERRTAAARAERVAALRVRLARIQAPHRGAARRLRPPPGASDAERLRARAALVGAVEASITADARARIATGELDGPIVATECGPLLKSKQAIPDDRVLGKPIGRYDCVAARHPVVDSAGNQVATLGHPFVAALDFRTFTYVWCRNTPAQGEAGQALVFVRLQRACLAAKGRALGTGYVDVPDS